MSKYCITFLFAINLIFGRERNFHIVTVTKSGTHLLKKLITLLSASWNGSTIYHFLDGYEIPNDPNILSKYIFLIRDPRDVIVSFVGHINMYPQWFEGHPYHPIRSSGWSDRYEVFGLNLDTWNSLSDSEKLSVLIKNRRYDTNEFSNDGRTLFSQWKRYLQVKEDFPHLLLRFEDIIGKKGNGDANTQKEMIKKVANFLDINVTEEKIRYIQENLFGDTWTFNKGKIGSWKKRFTQEHKKEFINVYGDILLDLPYDFSDIYENLEDVKHG